MRIAAAILDSGSARNGRRGVAPTGAAAGRRAPDDPDRPATRQRDAPPPASVSFDGAGPGDDVVAQRLDCPFMGRCGGCWVEFLTSHSPGNSNVTNECAGGCVHFGATTHRCAYTCDRINAAHVLRVQTDAILQQTLSGGVLWPAALAPGAVGRLIFRDSGELPTSEGGVRCAHRGSGSSRLSLEWRLVSSSPRDHGPYRGIDRALRRSREGQPRPHPPGRSLMVEAAELRRRLGVAERVQEAEAMRGNAELQRELRRLAPACVGTVHRIRGGRAHQPRGAPARGVLLPASMPVEWPAMGMPTLGDAAAQCRRHAWFFHDNPRDSQRIIIRKASQQLLPRNTGRSRIQEWQTTS